ncbi:Putative hem-containing dehydratase [Septoria linicola]|uniref:Hem-containing dehydratase n=1 Tax=Septoria linicola TaxID=215465 RepID=A0A9Q9ASG2_9PEZI|nr:Putative hem-containing dehydratase [Septoria linicola]
MAIIGVQHEGKVEPQGPEYQKLTAFVEKGTDSSKPKYWEAASVTDNRGFQNEVVIPYWQTKADFDQWKADSGFGEFWSGLQEQPEHGWFLEVFLPTIDRFETVFSDNTVPKGAANMRAGVSDRLIGEWAFPKSSTERADEVGTRTERIRVPGRHNLAMIRSGQDWSNTTPHERELYLETMHPVLTKGMDFLRDEGEEVGCISNRFMDCIHKTSPGEITERTLGLAYFDDLKSLEGWSKQHKTHLDIFGRFLQYAAELQNNVSLRLFHEVMVMKPEQQFFEYIGCHDTSGMLASI